jgi:hypothetical protein
VVVAILVLVYAGMHAASALRSFHFFQRIERLEMEARRLVAALGEVNSTSSRKQVVTEVTALRHAANQGLYRPAVPRHRHPALHRQDRDELSLAPSAERPLGSGKRIKTNDWLMILIHSVRAR